MPVMVGVAVVMMGGVRGRRRFVRRHGGGLGSDILTERGPAAQQQGAGRQQINAHLESSKETRTR
jgi:hypothetical protein